MNPKAVVPRVQAHRDVEEAVAYPYHLSEATAQVALGFVEALERAYAQVGRHAAMGSPRYAHELNLPGLRAWPLKRYPYIVFYVERPDCVDVWRVLHGQRDVPAWMRDPDSA